jgi:transcriptional regulator with XRE-family HTH domain
MSQEWTPEQVKELRLRLGKTQKEFAEMLGVHVVTIIRWRRATSTRRRWLSSSWTPTTHRDPRR